MKKISLKAILLLSLIVVLIQARGEEDPAMVLKVDIFADDRKEIESTGGEPCPNPGNNCKRATTGTAEQRQSEFEIFKKYYDNKDLKTYFEIHNNYEVFLPGIDRTDIISKIAQGSYLVKIQANNAILVYKNDQKDVSYDNLVFAFDPNIPVPTK